MTEPRLRDVRVLVTRPRERSQELCFLLEDEGAEVIAVPLLELLPPADPRPLVSAAEHIQRYDWVAFASPLAVEALIDALREAGTLEQLRRVRLAAVGPRTAARIQRAGFEVAVVAEAGRGVALAAAMAPRLEEGAEILLPAAEQGRDELAQALIDAGATVARVCAYRAEELKPEPALIAELRAHPPAAAIFASPRTVHAFSESFGAELSEHAFGPLRAVAIGPTTAAAVEEAGLTLAATAARPTPEALVEAVIAAVRG